MRHGIHITISSGAETIFRYHALMYCCHLTFCIKLSFFMTVSAFCASSIPVGGYYRTPTKNLQNADLWNHWADFLRLKFYGIAKTCNCAMSWPVPPLSHMGLNMGQTLEPNDGPLNECLWDDGTSFFQIRLIWIFNCILSWILQYEYILWSIVLSFPENINL